LFVGWPFAAQAFTEGFDPSAKLTGDSANTAGAKKQQHNDQYDNPFGTTW
jgi:hypothetical protein